MYAMGAEFVEVRVNAMTREIRVPRIVGAFAAGRLMNGLAKATARSTRRSIRSDSKSQ